jgi:hypothetical protein
MLRVSGRAAARASGERPIRPDSRRLDGRSASVGFSVALSASALAAFASFVPASKSLIASCHSTARAVGYPVPCPTRVPRGLVATGANGPTGCALHVIGPGGVGGCAASWRGWVVGSSTTSSQHLVITASPTPLLSYAKVVDGPAWYPKARVEPLAWVTVDRWRMRAVFVPPETNDGSAFARHVVLIWTVGGHTYGVGFHDVRGVGRTLALDEQLVESITLVGP